MSSKGTGSAAVAAETETALARHAGKYLTFKLDSEAYGLEILKVQEILGIMPVTRVPRTPAFVRGVVNLRGKVIPVVDLRAKFELSHKGDTEKTCIIVLQVARGSGLVTTSIVVDEVSEVLEIEARQLEPTPEFGSAIDTSYILAMGKIDDRVIMLLDADRVLSSEDVRLLAKLGKEDL